MVRPADDWTTPSRGPPRRRRLAFAAALVAWQPSQDQQLRPQQPAAKHAPYQRWLHPDVACIVTAQ